MANMAVTNFSAEQVVPWASVGKSITEATNAHEALVAAGLDWDVFSFPAAAQIAPDVYIDAPQYIANVKGDDNTILGIVSDKYKIVQNEEAFAFTDALVKNDFGVQVTYESAGSLNGGKRVWLMAKLPEREILTETFIPYLAIINNHDGKGAVRVVMTPIRVACANALALAIRSAERSWKTAHTGNLETKLEDAQHTLGLALTYMDRMEVTAERLQQLTISDSRFDEILEELFPHNPFARNQRANNNNEAARGLITDIYQQKKDLQRFKGNAWGVYNAFADYASHIEPKKRLTDETRFNERKFSGFLDGSNILGTVQDMLEQSA